MAVIKAPAKPVRGKDRGKLMKELGDWTEPVVVGEFDKGHKLLYLPHPDDLALLGKLMHHCSGTHFIWACEEKIWYFFALVDAKGVPIATLHTKEEKWLGKAHPRDSFPRPNIQIRASAGHYPTFSDYVAGFKASGQKYEPGKWSPLTYSSRTYDINRDSGDYNSRDFNSQYGHNRLPRRPDGIPEELFNEYMRCWKAMQDHYDKTAGVVKIQGRTFYFDGKKQIVLSMSGGAGAAVNSEPRKMVFEWLNQHQKKGGAVGVAKLQV